MSIMSTYRLSVTAVDVDEEEEEEEDEEEVTLPVLKECKRLYRAGQLMSACNGYI